MAVAFSPTPTVYKHSVKSAMYSTKSKAVMSLKTKLYEDMKTAMKARDAQRLETIRYMISVIKNVEIDHGEQTEDELVTIVRKQVKQMREAIMQFKQGNRDDLVDSEEVKVAILEGYLPKQLDEAQIESIVKNMIGAIENPNFALVMPQAMKALGGQAEGKMVAEVVRKLLP